LGGQMQGRLPLFFDDVENANDYLKTLRDQGKVLVTTNGCFDLLHYGHVRYLLEAAALGDILVVGINSDESVARLKGENRPLQSQKNRAYLVAALKMVDCTFIFPEDDPQQFLRVLKPDIHVKGGDYSPESLPERKIVEQYGGQIRIVSFVDGYSTTSIVKKINRNTGPINRLP